MPLKFSQNTVAMLGTHEVIRTKTISRGCDVTDLNLKVSPLDQIGCLDERLPTQAFEARISIYHIFQLA
jgi:hypothetical protein